jgi:hypothetical protein
MVMFLITDVFRDPDVGGWMKAFWLIALIVFPFITALAYLIPRGRGMAERAFRRGRVQVQWQAGHDVFRVEGLLQGPSLCIAALCSSSVEEVQDLRHGVGRLRR